MNIYINSIIIYLVTKWNNKAWNIFNQSMFHQLTIIFISLIFRSPPFWSSLWLFLGLVTSSESSIIYTRWGLSFPLVTFLSFAYFQNYLTDFVQQMCKCQLHIGVFHPNICLIWLQMPCTILISIFFCSSLLLAFQSSCWDHDSKQLFHCSWLIFFLWIRSFWWPSMEPKSRPGLPGNIMQHMILVNNDFVTLLSLSTRGHNLIIIINLHYQTINAMIMSFWRCCFWEGSVWFGCLPHEHLKFEAWVWPKFWSWILAWV